MPRASSFAPSSWRGTHSRATSTARRGSGSRRFSFERCWPYALAVSVFTDGALELNALWCIAEGHPWLGVACNTLATVIGVTAVFWIVRGVTRLPEPPKVSEVDPVMAELIRQREAMRRQHRSCAEVQREIQGRLHDHLARGR